MATVKSTSIVQYQLKLKLRPAQERLLNRWLWHLTGAYNWAIRKIELDAALGIYHGKGLDACVREHGAKVGVPTHTIQATVGTAVNAWQRCFKGLAHRPRFKSSRNKLNSIPFPDAFPPMKSGRVRVAGMGWIRVHSQELPSGKFKSGRIIKRASGWYLCLMIAAEPKSIPVVGVGDVGIDPGFGSLLTLSTGKKIEHPHELKRAAKRQAQAQRGKNRRLVARLRERETNRRKDRNHKLSRLLVSEYALIAWSRDPHRNIAKTFGKSVASAAHGQLRQQLARKCRAGGREFIEVPSRHSTRTCSACGALTGPTGWAGLSVRDWVCHQCGTEHDRDVNAALNTLNLARGLRVERAGDSPPEIAA